MYSKIHSRLNWFFGYIGEPEEDFEVELYGDVNFDGSLDITDVILLVNFVLGTTFSQSVQWLEENFPELKTKERLSKLNKEQNFTK